MPIPRRIALPRTPRLAPVPGAARPRVPAAAMSLRVAAAVLPLVAAAALSIAPAGAVRAAEPHRHEAHAHGTAAPAKLSLDHGKKWATDEPLRRNMGEIRASLAAKHEGIHKGTLAADEYKALGAAVEGGVAKIVAECKLPEAADANLHLVVADLLAATDTMAGKTQAKPRHGAVRAVEAVNRYGQYFDDPGWKPIR